MRSHKLTTDAGRKLARHFRNLQHQPPRRHKNTRPFENAGGSSIIMFEVDSAATAGMSSAYNGLTILTVTLTVEPCNQDIDTVDVVDWSSCLANAEELEALVGREGWAARGRGRQSLASGASEGEKTPCHWFLIGLCCP